MPHTDTDPTIPSDQEALLAREAMRALEGHPADGENLRIQVAAAGKEVTTLDLPAAAAAPLLAILKAMGEGKPVAVGRQPLVVQRHRFARTEVRDG